MPARLAAIVLPVPPVRRVRPVRPLATLALLGLPALLALLPSLSLAADAAPGEEGRRVYESVCSACHAPQNVMVSSPKAGDAVAWRQRLAKGLPATVDNAVNGLGAMPPKGGASELSREQIRQAILYMSTP